MDSFNELCLTNRLYTAENVLVEPFQVLLYCLYLIMSYKIFDSVNKKTEWLWRPKLQVLVTSKNTNQQQYKQTQTHKRQ